MSIKSIANWFIWETLALNRTSSFSIAARVSCNSLFRHFSRSSSTCISCSGTFFFSLYFRAAMLFISLILWYFKAFSSVSESLQSFGIMVIVMGTVARGRPTFLLLVLNVEVKPLAKDESFIYVLGKCGKFNNIHFKKVYGNSEYFYKGKI